MGSGATALATTRRTVHIYLQGASKRNLRHAKQSGPDAWSSAAGPRLLGLGRHLTSSHPLSGHPPFHLGDSPRKSRTLIQDSRTLLMLPNAHHLFRIHPINFPLHIFSPPALRRRATAHLYANYFATWTKVIMLSDRKLTGLKSKMEINKLTPLNAGQAVMRAALPGGGSRASVAELGIRQWLPGRPWPQSSTSSPLTYPVAGCIL